MHACLVVCCWPLVAICCLLFNVVVTAFVCECQPVCKSPGVSECQPVCKSPGISECQYVSLARAQFGEEAGVAFAAAPKDNGTLQSFTLTAWGKQLGDEAGVAFAAAFKDKDTRAVVSVDMTVSCVA